MLIINNDDVAGLLTMADCIRVQEDAFLKLRTGEAMHRPRVDMYVPCERDDGYFRWGSMEGANDGFFAIRMKSDILTWPRDKNGNWTEEKYCREPGTFCGLIFLISTRNAEPLAFINDGVLQHFRVGGGAGLGVKYLSREDSHVVGMLGSGGMARTFLDAFCCVRPIKRCNIYSPTPAHREAYAEEMSKRLGIEVCAVATPREAVRGAGLQMQQSERFQAERGLSPGAFIAGTAAEMARIPSTNLQPGWGGDSPQFSDRGKGGGKPDFVDLVSGKCAGRTSRDQITFYRNVGNQGLQFSSVGGWVYRQAVKQKKGREIPTAWF